MPKDFVTPKEKTPEQALNSLMMLCAKAEKSSGDALRLMYKWKISSQHQQEILQKLIATRFIDDRRYAEAFIREKTRLSGWGAYKIRATLLSKGIDKKIIEDHLSELDPEKLRETLIEKLKKKSRSISDSSDVYKVRAKIVRYGLSLGYDYDMVIGAVDKLDENL